MTKRDFLEYAEWLEFGMPYTGLSRWFNGVRGFLWDIADGWPGTFTYDAYAAVAESLAYDNTDGPADEVTR